MYILTQIRIFVKELKDTVSFSLTLFQCQSCGSNKTLISKYSHFPPVTCDGNAYLASKTSPITPSPNNSTPEKHPKKLFLSIFKQTDT